MARNEVVVIHDGANIIEKIFLKKTNVANVTPRTASRKTGTDFKTKEGGNN